MLVITRKIGQMVMIGDADVTVISICGDKVRLGITAPKEVRILRDDIIKRQRKEVIDRRLRAQ